MAAQIDWGAFERIKTVDNDSFLYILEYNKNQKNAGGKVISFKDFIFNISTLGVQGVTGNLVDNTNPQYPVINQAVSTDANNGATLGSDGLVYVPTNITGGVQGITGNLVDNTDPANPVVNAAVSSDSGNYLILGTDGLPYTNQTGPQGPQGVQGIQGVPGNNGTDGSVLRNGTGVPSNALGVDGDYYLENVSGDVYLKSSGTYSIVSNFKGPVGATGPTGATGPAGPSAVSTDPGNTAVLGSDSLIYVPASGGGGGFSVVMTTDFTTTSTTLATITELNVPIAANETLSIHWYLWLSATGAAGARYAFTVPTGCTAPNGGDATAQIFGNTVGITSYTTIPRAMNGVQTGLVLNNQSGGSNLFIMAWTTVTNGLTPGNVSIQIKAETAGQTFVVDARNSHADVSKV